MVLLHEIPATNHILGWECLNKVEHGQITLVVPWTTPVLASENVDPVEDGVPAAYWELKGGVGTPGGSGIIDELDLEFAREFIGHIFHVKATALVIATSVGDTLTDVELENNVRFRIFRLEEEFHKALFNCETEKCI